MKRRLFLAALTGVAASAHDLYLMPRKFRAKKPGSRLIGLHLGDGFPVSEQPVALERVRNARAVGAGGSVPMENIQVAGDRVEGTVDLPSEGTYVVAVDTAPNAIELAPGKFETYLEHEGLRSIIRWRKENGESKKPGIERYTKFVKSLVAVGKPDGFYSHQIGSPIEIMPQADPLALKPGDTLPIQVLFRGKPAPDLQIQTSWARGETVETEIPGRTDAEGRFNVAITDAGVWRLRTILMERRKQDDTDWESFWAGLTFEVP